MAYNPDQFAQAATTEAFSVAARLDLAVAVLDSWQGDLLREPRVCVPIDVQALVVPPGDPAGTEGVPLVGPLSPGSGAAGLAGGAGTAAHDAVTGPEPFAEPDPRKAGVHLHWALPDALLRGELADPTPAAGTPEAGVAGPTAGGGGLGMAALPDRWLVLRLLAPASGAGPAVARGWVIDAATGRSFDLAKWTGNPDGPGADAVPDTPVVPADGLTGSAGGTLTWTAGYDAAARRFTFHDPLDDLAADPTLGGTLADGPAAERATYTVAGWWSRNDLDPLDEIRGTATLDRRLAELAWRLLPAKDTAAPAPSGGTLVAKDATAFGALALADLGLPVATPYAARTARATGASAFVKESAFVPGLLAGGVRENLTFVPPARPPRPEASTLLHGCVVGVPVTGDIQGRVKVAELRPDPTATTTALGEHLFDAVGAMAAGSTAARFGVTGETDLGVVERLIAAFVRHELHLLADPAGAAQIDAGLHAAGFTSVETGEAAAVDTLVDGRVAPVPRGRRIGTVSGVAGVKGSAVLGVVAATKDVKLVMQAGTAETIALVTKQGARTVGTMAAARTAVSPAAAAAGAPAVAAPQVRKEERPAPPRWVPNDPYLAVRGAGRSLRHGGDGRWTEEGVLNVRHPSQLELDFPGVLSGADVLPSLGSGAVPAEASDLAREALLLSPHLAPWLADRAATRSVGGVTSGIYGVRIAAEHLLRFDARGAYSTEGRHRGVLGRGDRRDLAAGGRRPGGRHRVAGAAGPLPAGRGGPEPGRGHRLGAAVGADVAGVRGRGALGRDRGRARLGAGPDRPRTPRRH